MKSEIEFILENEGQYECLDDFEIDALRRLMAEHTELLAACEATLDFLSGWPDAIMEPGERELIDQLRAAVAKATGQEQSI